MKTIIALLALTALNVQAEEMAKYFVYKYDDTTSIYLLPDQCNKSDVSMGWIAYAENDKKDKAEGCWRHSADGLTVEISLDAGGGKYIDYQLWASKFEAKYE